jgi:Na+-transporting NADH:ubiquinone oxidoreductase subunit D
MGNRPWSSFIDGIGNGLGYAIILVVVGFVRELFGSGTLWGYRVVPESFYIENGGVYANNGLVILPPMALILVGIIIWVQRARNKELIEK